MYLHMYVCCCCLWKFSIWFTFCFLHVRAQPSLFMDIFSSERSCSLCIFLVMGTARMKSWNLLRLGGWGGPVMFGVLWREREKKIKARRTGTAKKGEMVEAGSTYCHQLLQPKPNFYSCHHIPTKKIAAQWNDVTFSLFFFFLSFSWPPEWLREGKKEKKEEERLWYV